MVLDVLQRLILSIKYHLAVLFHYKSHQFFKPGQWVIINPQAISRIDVPTISLAGSLQHALLHRQGYRHPAGVYTYFADESSMWVMRGNALKTPGVPDSRYSVFLD